MNHEIHPKYEAIKVTCSGCGYETTVGSTLGRPLSIEVCSNCHPFYTGKTRGAAAGGRIDAFNKRFARRGGKGNEAAGAA